MNSYTKTLAVIFDMDGILVDSEPLWAEAENEVLKSVGIDTHHMLCPVETLGLRINETVAAWHHFYPWSNKTQQEIIDEIDDSVIQKVTKTRPILPGVVEALELCHKLNLKVGLASSSSARVIHAITHLLNINHYFEVCCSAESLSHGKPHPEVYLSAAQALEVPALNCLTIEDSVNGMIATKAARMRSIVVPDKAIRDDPRWVMADRKLNSLLELTPELLVGK